MTIAEARPPQLRTPSLGHRPGLDGVRAFAVGLVLLNHVTFPGMVPSVLVHGSPEIGVDVFFVLSGFLITRLLLDEVNRNDRIALGRFWARRVLRLMPLAVAVVAAVLLLDAFDSTFFYREGADVAPWRAGLAAVGYHMNILQMRDGTHHIWALTHTWSLSIEEQFYVVWPAFLAVALRGRRAKAPMIVFVSSCVVMVLSALDRALLFRDHHDAYAYNSLESRAGQLCAGAALAAATLLWPQLVARVGRLGWVGFAGLALIGLRDVGHVPFAPHYDEVSIFSVLLVAGACGFRGDDSLVRVMRVAPLQWLGKRSYALYLVHYPVMLAITREGTGWGTAQVMTTRLGLSLLVAEVAHRVIERPTLALRSRYRVFGAV